MRESLDVQMIQFGGILRVKGLVVGNQDHAKADSVFVLRLILIVGCRTAFNPDDGVSSHIASLGRHDSEGPLVLVHRCNL